MIRRMKHSNGSVKAVKSNTQINFRIPAKWQGFLFKVAAAEQLKRGRRVTQTGLLRDALIEYVRRRHPNLLPKAL